MLYIFTDYRNEADSFSSMLLLTKNMKCIRQFKIHIQISFQATGLFLPGLAEKSWQESEKLAKKDSFNNFIQNTA